MCPGLNWVQGVDLNQRPSGYEPDELPGCSTPRSVADLIMPHKKREASAFFARDLEAPGGFAGNPAFHLQKPGVNPSGIDAPTGS